MLFPAVVGDDQAEIAFARVKNVSGGAFAVGDSVVLDVSAPDGVRVTTPVAGSLGLLVGICVAAIANGAYGVVQTYGYNSVALVTNDLTTATVIGDMLVPVTTVTSLKRSAVSTGIAGFVFALEAIATSTTGLLTAVAKKVWIKNL